MLMIDSIEIKLHFNENKKIFLIYNASHRNLGTLRSTAFVT